MDKKLIKKYLELEIGLTDKKSNYDEMVREIHDDFDVKNDIFSEIRDLNRLFGRHYGGRKWKYDFVLREKIEDPKLSASKKQMERIKLAWLEINDRFSKGKRKITEVKFGKGPRMDNGITSKDKTGHDHQFSVDKVTGDGACGIKDSNDRAVKHGHKIRKFIVLPSEKWKDDHIHKLGKEIR